MLRRCTLAKYLFLHIQGYNAYPDGRPSEQHIQMVQSLHMQEQIKMEYMHYLESATIWDQAVVLKFSDEFKTSSNYYKRTTRN